MYDHRQTNFGEFMKTLISIMLLGPTLLFSMDIDEDLFHEIILEEISTSAEKSYRLHLEEDPDMVELNALRIWYEAGYQKGLLIAQEALYECKKD